MEFKNTGVGSLFLLQQIFPTQVSNQGLLHCRRILYQLSYQGSPDFFFFLMPLEVIYVANRNKPKVLMYNTGSYIQYLVINHN